MLELKLALPFPKPLPTKEINRLYFYTSLLTPLKVYWKDFLPLSFLPPFLPFSFHSSIPVGIGSGPRSRALPLSYAYSSDLSWVFCALCLAVLLSPRVFSQHIFLYSVMRTFLCGLAECCVSFLRSPLYTPLNYLSFICLCGFITLFISVFLSLRNICDK